MTDTVDDRSLRVIQIGIGGFGSSWAEIARKAEGITLAAVVDPSPVAREWAHATLGLGDDQIFASIDDALNVVECDAILVITPPVTHHAVATQALLAGKHVLIEKPLAATMPEADELIETAKRQNRMLVVSQNYRFRSPARTIQRFVGDGEIGSLLAVKVTCRRDTRGLWPVDNFRYQMQHPYIVDMAIHHFDLIRALTGRNVARIDARSWRVPDSPYVHEPTMAAVIDLEDGVPVTYQGDWATSQPETSWNGDWTFVGQHGRLLWSGGVDDP
jgi:predicted dehydrogenase